VFSKYFMSGVKYPHYNNIEWVKALYTNWVGACVTLVIAFVASGAKLEPLFVDLSMQGWWLEIYMGVSVSVGTIITFQLLELIGALAYWRTSTCAACTLAL
jgi:hypothetical protein